jgi:hypothetical protein
MSVCGAAEDRRAIRLLPGAAALPALSLAGGSAKFATAG